MTIKDMQDRAIGIARRYKSINQPKGLKDWDASAYMAGFVGDVGDLSKLVMAKAKLREFTGVDAKIAHELADCLWSVLVLSHELGIDIEDAFANAMAELDRRLDHTS
jgi:NTP pyrophosphatase (non-canonical NTP hydrolase)